MVSAVSESSPRGLRTLANKVRQEKTREQMHGRNKGPGSDSNLEERPDKWPIR